MTRRLRKTLISNWRFIVLQIAVLQIAVTTGLLCGASQSNNLDSFAQCLAAKKVTMYGSFLCPHCEDQRKMFGSSFRYVPYVECSMRGSHQMTFPCTVAQIRFTPTWILANDERLVGVQPLKTLSDKTGCKLP